MATVPAPGLPSDFKEGAPLPISVTGGIQNLSPAAKQQIATLMGPRLWLYARAALGAWAIIFLTIWVACQLNNIGATLIAIFIVATRQNILGLLVHEQSHCLAARSKIGDRLANLFVAWPLLAITVENYSRVHLAHHRYYFTENDPDFLRKNGVEWTFPMKAGYFTKLFLRDFFAMNLLKTIKSKNKKEGSTINRPAVFPPYVRIAYYVLWAAVLTYFKLWPIFLIYWVLPLFTVLQLIVRFGAICEHKYNLLNTDVAASTPIIVLRWWEKIILPNLNFTYHIYHHFYPGISYAYLPKIHEIFIREGLVKKENIFNGYASFIKHLQGMNQMAHELENCHPAAILLPFSNQKLRP